MPTVRVADRDIVIERFTLSKAVRVITLLTELQRQVPELTREWAEFRRDYATAYATQLDRVQAKVQYPDRVVYDSQDNPVLLPSGEVATIPSAVSQFSEEDWERAGQVFRVPAEPSGPEMFMQMAPLVFEKAQEPVFRLLSIIAVDNAKVSEYAAKGTLYDRLDEFAAETLANADITEIMELCTVAAEVVDSTILAKARTLGKRLAPMRAILGLAPKATTTDAETTTDSTLSRPPVEVNTVSVSASPESSASTPNESSPSPGTSSPTSSNSPTERPTPTTERATATP